MKSCKAKEVVCGYRCSTSAVGGRHTDQNTPSSSPFDKSRNCARQIFVQNPGTSLTAELPNQFPITASIIGHNKARSAPGGDSAANKGNPSITAHYQPNRRILYQTWRRRSLFPLPLLRLFGLAWGLCIGEFPVPFAPTSGRADEERPLESWAAKIRWVHLYVKM